jgi:hypothetical protein
MTVHEDIYGTVEWLPFLDTFRNYCCVDPKREFQILRKHMELIKLSPTRAPLRRKKERGSDPGVRGLG